ncbi:MAG: DUF3784 domain-containing protein [Bacillota bacterium]
MGEVIVMIIVGIGALSCLVISVLQFNEKGVVFNNVYIYASKEQKQTMDKKSYYKQSAVVFALLTGVFLSIGLSMVFETRWFFVVEGILLVVTVLYTIMSAITLAKRKKK